MGMTKREMMSEGREFYFKVMFKPTLFLVSLVIVGWVLDSILGTNNSAKLIFIGIGGLGYLIQYYKETFSLKK